MLYLGVPLVASRCSRLNLLISSKPGDDLLVENPKSKNTYPHITLSRADGAPRLYSQVLFAKSDTENHMEYFNDEYGEVVEGYCKDGVIVVNKGAD